ncbi:UPF0271 protein [Prauserella sediminis]|uniref:UPF0271 protein n=1 Tax=Prauserella sediminis TaxID=577680 RepID=A0A839XUB0_9PSEU|nr:5-oxoprolinase subunit PxpA [Prauserella sediminis]MBB3666311.1 UPF0271 protein [Prauserella sediminis]
MTEITAATFDRPAGYRTIDLIADLGESFGAWTMGRDTEMLDMLTSANVACGFHAGDPRTMAATVRACADRGIGVGAHPSFPDLVGFGRRTMELSAEEVHTDTLYQLGALHAFTTAAGVRVQHLAPHGRLGNLAGTRQDYAEAIVAAARDFDPGLTILAQPGCLAETARQAGLDVALVGMADRAYRADGGLVPRGEPGAVITDPALVGRRTVKLVTEGQVEAIDGTLLDAPVDTILLHGDNAEAVEHARSIRHALAAAGVTFVPLGQMSRRAGNTP